MPLVPRPSTLDPQPSLRLGLRTIRGLPQALAEAIQHARRQGPFTSLADLAHRAGLSRAEVVRLARADAFGSLGLDRRNALWQALGEGSRVEGRGTRAGSHNDEAPLFGASQSSTTNLQSSIPSLLPPLSLWEEVLADYRAAGMSLRPHPLAFFREQLGGLGALRAEELATAPTGRQVRVAGLVLVRQRPSTASGITFVTLEDETGQANLIVRPDVWERFRRPARQAAALLAHGQLQREGQVIHVLVNKLEDLAPLLGAIPSASRDFR